MPTTNKSILYYRNNFPYDLHKVIHKYLRNNFIHSIHKANRPIVACLQCPSLIENGCYKGGIKTFLKSTKEKQFLKYHHKVLFDHILTNLEKQPLGSGALFITILLITPYTSNSLMGLSNQEIVCSSIKSKWGHQALTSLCLLRKQVLKEVNNVVTYHVASELALPFMFNI